MNIAVNPKACYGCRACELVCAYNHLRVFTPEGGSIKVYRDYRTVQINWYIDTTCDLCAGEDQPYVNDIVPMRLSSFLKRRNRLTIGQIRGGLVGKILRVNLSSGNIETEETEKYAKEFIGG